MKFVFLFFAFIGVQMGFSQSEPTESKTTVENKVYEITGLETKPEFPGGINEFYKFIGKNFRAPNDKNFKGGKLFVSFVIEKDGSVKEIKVIRDIGFKTAEEAVRVLSKSPNWSPGMQSGKAVRVLYTLPIQLSPS